MGLVAVSRRCRKSHSSLESSQLSLVPSTALDLGHDSQENGRHYGNAHSVAPCCSETSREAHDEGV